MSEFDLEVWLRLLDESLGMLASDAHEQIAYLRSKGVAPSADELGLEFDTGWRPVERVLAELSGTDRVIAALNDLDRSLDDSAVEWDLSALTSSASWARVRLLADHARELLREWRAHRVQETV